MEIVQDQNGRPQQPADEQQPVNAVTGSDSLAPEANSAVSPLSIGLSFVLPPASSKTLPLAIANRGDTDVDWTADVGGEKWLTLDRHSGHIMAHEVQTLYVTANSRSLKLGDNHLAIVTLTPQGHGMKPARIAVELQISLSANDDGGPHIAIVKPVRPAGPQLADLQGGKNTRSWRITNPASNGQVKWTMNAGGVDWVTKIDPPDGTLQGGGQVTIEVTTDTTLAPGAGKYRTDLVLTFTFVDPNKKNREPSSVRIPLPITVPKV
jgi:hypothetical protein